MEEQSECLSSQQLQDYLAGRLDEEQSESVEGHLAECSVCEATVAELDGSSDTLMRTLRLRPGNSSPGEDPGWVKDLADGQAVDGQQEELEVRAMSQMGDYELQRVLGRGGMSIVFAARHQHLGREVALKVLVPGVQHQTVSRERFSREMRAVGQLDHPTIVRATDAGQWQGTLYLVMEKVDGVDLTTMSRRSGPLAYPEACAIIAQAAHGLSHAHAAGIIHRDVKPSNLMIDRRGHVKILDFGLARSATATGEVSMQTTVGQLLGTLDYMAPEQSNRSDVEAAADVYALGATLFKLLAGIPPHGRSADGAVLDHLNRLANQPAPRLSEFRQDLPEDLVSLVDQMLQRDVSRRLVDLSAIVARLSVHGDNADLPALVRQTLVADVGDEDPSVDVQQSLAEIWPSPALSAPVLQSVGDKPQRGTRRFRTLATYAPLACLVLVACCVSWLRWRGDSLVITDIPLGTQVRILEPAGQQVAIATSQIEPNQESTIRNAEPSTLTVPATGQAQISPAQNPITPQTQLEPPTDPAERFIERDVQSEFLQEQLLEKQLQMSQLKSKYSTNHPKVVQLQQELSLLTALAGRNAPTEPVYEGQTLRQWQALMRFEQEPEARRNAAARVLNLSKTLDDESAFLTAVEAAMVVFDQRGESAVELEQEILRLLMSPPTGDSPQALLEAAGRVEGDRGIQWLEEKFQRGSESEQRTAMYLVALLGSAIRDDMGTWTSLLQALARLGDDEQDPLYSVSRTVAAWACPDTDYVAGHLSAADSRHASADSLLSWFIIQSQRGLEIETSVIIEWMHEYCQSAKKASDLETLILDPSYGPLVGVQWDNLSDQHREIVIGVSAALVDDLLQAKEKVPVDSAEKLSRISRALCRFVHLHDFQEPLRTRVTEAMDQRLNVVLQLRMRQEYVSDHVSDLASGLVLLTGKIPESVFFATRVKDLQGLQDITDRSREGGTRLATLETAKAYPMETLDLLFSIGGSGYLLMSQSQFIEMARNVNLPLMASYLLQRDPQSRRSGAEYFEFLADPKELRRYAASHSTFRDLLWQIAEIPGAQIHAAPVIDALGFANGSENQFNHMLGWIEGGDPRLRNYALQYLCHRYPQQFEGPWAGRLGAAIGSISLIQNHDAGYSDATNNVVYYLTRLGRSAAPSVPSLIEYVESSVELDADSILAKSIPMRSLLNQAEQEICINECVLQVLSQFPEQIADRTEVFEQLIELPNPPYPSKRLAELLQAAQGAP